ncbi:class I SAM-dependent rRNA methyltransferase [Tengunoibacter tsumagoiensis]|uniref:Ribosomal RNA large subunit methyltransferase I n=1 Tax=Tengunoibacter tsumagoiensis TaxID=2014871 RepID=A0A402A1R9_9CHLR|nr:class I SAM-dependent rRNA methyltransferase [Tengunoibacter tsumagoiensis]GCE13100.1 ribosomal RNA large subunit methyltransferase I [Tengunoibacter tsumagoiensis]
MSSVHYPSASLKPHRDESLQGGHLWIFSGALQQPPRWVEIGGVLDVKSATGKFVARGYYNPQTDIAIRILTYNPEEQITVDFLRRRVAQAVQLRQVFDPELTNAYRLINSEGDGLPGLVVDRYADVLVAQIHTAGMERLRPLLIEALMQETGAQGLLFRNDSQSRKREGLDIEEPMIGAGTVPDAVTIRENGVYFTVDCWNGQKTGFFLDQRDKRESLRKYARGKRILNCFSYTGGFSVYGALTSPDTTVTSVDVSAPAMEAAQKHFELNHVSPDAHEFLIADVFDYLEEAVQNGEQFDIVILDPPAFAKTQNTRTNALKAYRRLNTLGMQVLRPGGILLTCSCSGVIGMDDVLGVISQSAQRLQRPVQLLESYTHGVDHPIHIAMPETSYLKSIFCRVG